MNRYATALILGYGRSGRAAERMLRAEGTETTVLARETAGDAEVQLTLHDRNFDVCIVSPGFGLEHPWICAVRDAGIPLLSELELGWSRHRGRTIAITGSNGKSTAVKWICEGLKAAGISAAIGGNYGIPACEVVFEHPDLEWLVLEVSSFQLETVSDFKPEIAVILNVLPNHLDRHGSMETYWRTKCRIFGPDSASGNICIAPVEWIQQFRKDAIQERAWITFGGSEVADYQYVEGKVMHHGEVVINLSGTLFGSPVIGSCTGAAVTAAADAAGLPPARLESVARSFEPLPHRMQKLGAIDGVEYIDDSKATNLSAMAAAVEGCRGKVHLIAGGLSKETDYTFVKEILAERIMSIYLIGQASRAMYQAWDTVCPCVECGTLETAFKRAKMTAKTGETVLLSPGCASFDQFSGFEERGACFDALFRNAVEVRGDVV